MVPENKSHFQINFPILSTHPQWKSAEMIIQKLQSEGFEALIAGGAVRDLLMGHIPGDIDVATSAQPEVVEKLFPHTVNVGKAFGVIRVIDRGHSIEVATYRKDLNYQDGRRPEAVVFTNRVEDAKRRDFTINALFYDPFSTTVYDDVDGKKDIENKLLKCVGVAADRFHEDELRRLRLVRFVSQLGFKIEKQTELALKKGIEGLRKISKERITEEVGKMWMGSHLQEAFQIWLDSGMAQQIDPAWERDSTIASGEVWKISRADKKMAFVHYFSFFFEGQNFKDRLKSFRLPLEVENYVSQVFDAYQRIPEFLKCRQGEQRYWAGQKGFLLGLQYYIAKKAKADESLKLRQIYQTFSALGVLPEPLIKAHHLQPQYQGPQLGKALKQLYIEQLEHNWTEESQALNWLKTGQYKG